MDEMMTVYYERTRRLLQNTGWWKEYEQGLYYNMGATYLAVGRYEEALDCLNRVRSEDFLLCHKKAWLHLLLGNTREADHYLAIMKQLLSLFQRRRHKTVLHPVNCVVFCLFIITGNQTAHAKRVLQSVLYFLIPLHFLCRIFCES